MKSGRNSWTSKLSSAELQALHDWIDSDADYQAADIYRGMNLQRYCVGRTFRRYVEGRRREQAQRQSEGQLPPSSFSPDSLEQMTLDALGKTLLTGEMPAYVLPRVMAALARLEVAQIRKAADERAAEKHEVWKIKHQREQEAALDGLEAPGLTAEAKAKIKAEVLGL